METCQIKLSLVEFVRSTTLTGSDPSDSPGSTASKVLHVAPGSNCLCVFQSDMQTGIWGFYFCEVRFMVSDDVCEVSIGLALAIFKLKWSVCVCVCVLRQSLNDRQTSESLWLQWCIAADEASSFKSRGPQLQMVRVPTVMKFLEKVLKLENKISSTGNVLE